MMEGVQQIWLAGMGALARAQRDGPMQARIDRAMSQANDTWDSLETMLSLKRAVPRRKARIKRASGTSSRRRRRA